MILLNFALPFHKRSKRDAITEELSKVSFLERTPKFGILHCSMKHNQQLFGDPLTFPQFPIFLTFFLMKFLSFCIHPQEFTSLIFIDMSQELDPLSQVILW